MIVAAAVDWKPTPHARRVKRSRGVVRRLPRAVRIAIGDARSPDAKAKRLGRAEAREVARRAFDRKAAA